MQKLFSLRKFVSRTTLRTNPLAHHPSHRATGHGLSRSYTANFQHQPPLLQPLSRRLALSSSWKDRVGNYLKKYWSIKEFEAELKRVRQKLRSPYFRSGFTINGVLKGLIATNLAVFLLWRVADTEFMKRNFTVQLDYVKSGGYHTMITSAFSHIEAKHFFCNMLGLFMFGKSIGHCVGPEFLLRLYLVGGFSGSVSYLMHRAYLASSYKDTQTAELDPAGLDTQTLEPKAAGLDTQMVERDPSKNAALGASGAVTAIVFFDILLFPKQILLVDFIPLPAMLAGIYMVWKDIERVKKNDRVAGSAHLGGAVVGAIAWARLRRRL